MIKSPRCAGCWRALLDEDRAATLLVSSPHLADGGQRHVLDADAELPGVQQIQQLAQHSGEHFHARHGAGAHAEDLNARAAHHSCGQRIIGPTISRACNSRTRPERGWADRSPRISPIEPCIADGRLLVGIMPWSAKAADLRRDPRYVLRSVVTGPDSGEEELKLRGCAVPADPRVHGAAGDAWWSNQPPDKAIVFALRIGQAVFVVWDIERGVMTVHR